MKGFPSGLNLASENTLQISSLLFDHVLPASMLSCKTEKNLSMAKQTIDILSMLEEKTAGNLSKDEEDLLKNILYDLRIIYVKEKE